MSEPAVPAQPTSAGGRRRRRRATRIIVPIVIVVSGIAVAVGGGFYVVTDHLADQIRREPHVFTGLADAARPPDTDPLTFLLVGTDSGRRATHGGPHRSFPAGSRRSDLIALAQFDEDRTRATVVSIPRHSWVDVPGHGRTKIDTAYAEGGPQLLVKAVESLTRVRVDHFAGIDFAGFRSLTAAVGGIDVNIRRATRFGPVTFQSGLNHLDGREALAFVRQRDGLPRGDLSRTRRHQAALRALLDQAVSKGHFTDASSTYRFLDTLTRWVSVDDTLTSGGLRSLAFDLRNLRPDDVTFLTAPVAGTGRKSGRPVVYLDRDQAGQLWNALVRGEPETYLRKHPDAALGATSP